jgi:predicted HD phosphohydrolase|tara:strand:+ start:301 stop:843 length:543 start_codon:yes stop_codon:yes gene_type:complete
MNKQATFTRFDDCTKEDIDAVIESYNAFAKGLPSRVLDHLRLLDGDFGGFNVDRLQHCLQTATRAHHDGKDEEYVVCALLHDIGDTLGTYNHGAVAAAILKPFVSNANHWMLEQHPIFQGYYYFEHIGENKNARDKLKDSPHYDHALEFIEKYDMPSFDHNYQAMTLAEFEPMVNRVLSK